MGEHSSFRVAFVLALLVTATCVLAAGLIVHTIKVQADADGFVTWHKVFYDAAAPGAPAPADPAPSRPVVNITDDPGGNVAAYYQKYVALNTSGAEIHFHGMCASSCTLIFLKEFTNIRACADDGAIFGFHKPFQEINGKVIRTKSAVRDTRKLWDVWLRALPDPLRKYLQRVRVPSAAEGDEQNVMLILPGSVLLPRCPTEVAAK